MRTRSLPLRLDRLAGHGAADYLDRTVRELAEEFGLDPAEVRAELVDVAERVRRFGPCTPGQAIERCTAEFGLSEDILWAEYDRISGTARQ